MCKTFKKGWILFEVTIVITIFLFIALLSFEFIILTSKSFAFIELEKLYAFVLFMQSKAQLENLTYEIIFNDQRNCYEAPGYFYKLSSDIEFGFIDGVKGPPSSPNTIIKNSITFKNKKIILYKDGTINSGTIYITDKKRSCLYALTSGVGQYPFLRRYIYQKQWNLLK